jgi:hypothetical protein
VEHHGRPADGNGIALYAHKLKPRRARAGCNILDDERHSNSVIAVRAVARMAPAASAPRQSNLAAKRMLAFMMFGVMYDQA